MITIITAMLHTFALDRWNPPAAAEFLSDI